MTLFDQGYSAFRYEPVAPLGRIWALAQAEFGKLFKSRKGLVLFIACVVYVVVLLVLVFVFLGPESGDFQAGLSQLSPRLSPFTREFYLGYSTDQGFLAFIALSAVVSARSIAGDKATNALEIYWTRGISPWGYFLGKWLGSLLLFASVFAAGPLVAWIYAAISAPDLKFVEATIRFIPLVLLALLVKCLVLSFLAVGFSGLGSSPNIVTFLWLVLILGSAAFIGVLQGLTRMHARRNPEFVEDAPEWYEALSPWDAMVRIERDIAGVADATDYPVWLACASLGALCVLLLLLLRKRLRTTEAMA